MKCTYLEEDEQFIISMDEMPIHSIGIVIGSRYFSWMVGKWIYITKRNDSFIEILGVYKTPYDIKFKWHHRPFRIEYFTSTFLKTMALDIELNVGEER